MVDEKYPFDMISDIHTPTHHFTALKNKKNKNLCRKLLLVGDIHPQSTAIKYFWSHIHTFHRLITIIIIVNFFW